MPDVHVIPVDDLIAHDETRDCWCTPTVTEDPDARHGLVVHHAADCRELIEEHGIN